MNVIQSVCTWFHIYILILLHFHPTLALNDAASVNVSISSQNIQNGSLLTLTATCDPTVGASTFVDLRCRYSDPAGVASTDLTQYNFIKTKVIKDAGLSKYNSARLNITSPVNPMVLVISPITFDDEKKLFYCLLNYADALGNVQPAITSEQLRLENVYSEWLLLQFYATFTICITILCNQNLLSCALPALVYLVTSLTHFFKCTMKEALEIEILGSLSISY